MRAIGSERDEAEAVLAASWAGAAAPGARIVLVPGGGPFADAVRDADRTLGLGSDTAHWMAILAMDQYAHLLRARIPRAIVIENPGRIRATCRCSPRTVGCAAPTRYRIRGTPRATVSRHGSPSHSARRTSCCSNPRPARCATSWMRISDPCSPPHRGPLPSSVSVRPAQSRAWSGRSASWERSAGHSQVFRSLRMPASRKDGASRSKRSDDDVHHAAHTIRRTRLPRSHVPIARPGRYAAGSR